MKIKREFITNSSSCSFVVMGCCITYKDIPDPVMQLMEVNNEWTREQVEGNLMESLHSLIYKSDLKHSRCGDFYSDNVYIGIPYTKMDEDETLGEFKQRARDLLKQTLGIDKEVSHIEHGWESR